MMEKEKVDDIRHVKVMKERGDEVDGLRKGMIR